MQKVEKKLTKLSCVVYQADDDHFFSILHIFLIHTFNGTELNITNKRNNAV